MMTIAPYTPELAGAVEAFNGRLARGGIAYRFPAPERPAGSAASPPVRRVGFVALQDGRHVRGGYLIKQQDFWLAERQAVLSYIHLPLSEGLIDRVYGAVGLQLIAHALTHHPLLFGLGIGGRDQAFARILATLGWTLAEVPFYFHVVHPFRVARGLTFARRDVRRRLLLDLAALSGTAWTVARTAQWRPAPNRSPDAPTLHQVDRFGDWADELWVRCRAAYRLIGWRDAATLNHLYAGGSRFLRFALAREGRVTGWVVALDTQMRRHAHFGDLRLGTIVDCLGEPQDAPALIRAITAHLAGRGVDLIVSNQSAGVWSRALRRTGYMRWTSNFLYAASPALAAHVEPLPQTLPDLHLTRGDGDGPINL